MKLNLDCVRSILMCVEENTGLHRFCYFVDIGFNQKLKDMDMNSVKIHQYQQALMEQYDNDELIYHVRYCLQAGLIENSQPPTMGTHVNVVTDLTPKGHEFLANTRTSVNWEKAKKIGGKVGAFGLEMASKISEGIATAALNKLLGP